MIRIILGDITELTDVDVIVNSAKKTLMGGGGVDGAIHSKSGSELLKECKKLHGCNVGEAKMTKGYNLHVPYVIHAVGPIHYSEEWAKEHNYNQAELLRNAYMNSLILAKKYDLNKIAFSAIATGAFGYPIKEATTIALDTITEFLKSNPIFNVTFVLYSEELYEEYIEQIKSYDSIAFSAERLHIGYEFITSIEDIRTRYNIITNESVKYGVPSINRIKENIFKEMISKIFNRPKHS